MHSRSITSRGWVRSVALCVSLCFGITAPDPAQAASFEGTWSGEAALECDNFGDARPPIRVKTEFRIGDGELSGTWTTPNGEIYEVKGAVNGKGKII